MSAALTLAVQEPDEDKLDQLVRAFAEYLVAAWVERQKPKREEVAA